MKRGFFLLTALVVSTLVIFIFLKSHQEKSQASQEAAVPSAPAAQSSGSAAIVADAKTADLTKSETTNSSASGPMVIKPLISYREEAKAIAKLVARLPQSKPMLLEMIEKEDVFKNPKIQLKEHSIDEITQNQLGATKVMALRALMKAEKDPEKIKEDIDHIIQAAKDPTIVKIAKAARDSIDKGGHFPEDLLNGIDQMPLKN